ncbi:MAG: AAA family ATPase, partial [Planctomycetota bacterium]
EAQLDRFLFKIAVPYTTRGEMNEIVGRTTKGSEAAIRPVLDGPTILEAQRLARRVVVAPHVQDYAIRLVLATHPDSPHLIPGTRRYIHVGVSPRGAQALVCAAKVMALIDGRYAVAFRDLRSVARPALRHRIIRSFEAEADGVTTDDIVEEILEHLPREPEALPAAGDDGRHEEQASVIEPSNGRQSDHG